MIGAAAGGVALVGAISATFLISKQRRITATWRATHDRNQVVTVAKTETVQMTTSTSADTHPADIAI